jgi:hypothetical protein
VRISGHELKNDIASGRAVPSETNYRPPKRSGDDLSKKMRRSKVLRSAASTRVLKTVSIELRSALEHASKEEQPLGGRIGLGSNSIGLRGMILKDRQQQTDIEMRQLDGIGHATIKGGRPVFEQGHHLGMNRPQHEHARQAHERPWQPVGPRLPANRNKIPHRRVVPFARKISSLQCNTRDKAALSKLDKAVLP